MIDGGAAVAGPSGEGAASRRTLTARRIAELVDGELLGDEGAMVHGVASIERAERGSVTFLGAARYAPFLASSQASVLLVTPGLQHVEGPVIARVVVQNPHAALLSLLPHLYVVPSRNPGIDATVRLGRGAKIGNDVEIGPYVVIGEHAVIGDRARLGAQVVIGAGVVVGEDAQLFPHVTAYSGTTIGARVVVHAGVRLGSDGFGFVFSGGSHHKIPHVGRCIIESDVEIGANTTIDRGSIDDTVIGAGTKIDNLVQIGHNVRIGRLCLIMAQVGLSGSVRVGDGCIIAGQAGVQGHHSIGDAARIGGQAGVFGDVPAGETWSGYPARPHREALRSIATLFKLSGMVKRLERLLGDQV